MEAYLDNSATTMAYPEVGELVYKVMCRDYGNPSSMHRKGVDAEHYVKGAKESLAKLMKVNVKEIFFTSGGTESDNLALIGCARANRRAGNHLITTSIEHPAILNTMRYLEEEEGFRVTYLPVDCCGRVKLDALKEALCPETILVSIMYVNNEVGTVQPVEEAASIVKDYNPSILFHSDAVQGFGKYRIYPKRQKIDLLSVSGHKIHGPKGVGFLYIDEKVKIRPLIYGGGQQKDMRSGTENVAGIVGIGTAVNLIYNEFDSYNNKLKYLRDYYITQIEKNIPNIKLNGDKVKRLPGNANISFDGIDAGQLLLNLDAYGICASAGSACTSGSLEPSHVLIAIGLKENLTQGALRTTFGKDNTKEDVDFLISCIKNSVNKLRIF